jgi:hypothetical protein
MKASEIRLTPEEIKATTPIANWMAEWMPGDIECANRVSQAQLRKVVEYLKDRRGRLQADYDKWTKNLGPNAEAYEATGMMKAVIEQVDLIISDIEAALKEAAGLTMTENPVDK